MFLIIGICLLGVGLGIHYGLLYWIARRLGKRHYNNFQFRWLIRMVRKHPGAILYTIFINATIEEIIFRVIPSLVSTSNVCGILSSGMFAAAHVLNNADSIFTIVAKFGFGMIMWWLYIIGGTLWYPILFHSLWNTVWLLPLAVPLYFKSINRASNKRERLKAMRGLHHE